MAEKAKIGLGSSWQIYVLQRRRWKKLVRWYKPRPNKMLKVHPGATKSIVKTKDELRKAGAREIKGWSSWWEARLGRRRLSQGIHEEQGSVLVRHWSHVMGTYGLIWRSELTEGSRGPHISTLGAEWSSHFFQTGNPRCFIGTFHRSPWDWGTSLPVSLKWQGFV